MNIAGELEALRAEQTRLRIGLSHLDQRIAELERASRCTPEPAPEAPAATASILTPEPSTSSPAIPSTEAAAVPPEPPPLPLPPATKPPAPRDSLELQVGRVWLVRFGIVILLTGLVFLGNYAYHEFIGRIGPVGKLALLYLAGLGMGAIGDGLSRRRISLRTYGRVLLAGGCATIYYATYAAHFVPALKVIESPLLAGTLLLALGGGFVFLADRRRSQMLAGATVALSYYVSAINAVATFSLFSNLVISAVAVVLLARRRWASVTFLSLLGSYGSFAFWRFAQTSSLGPAAAANSSAFAIAVLFPAAYWIVHTAATLLQRTNRLSAEARPVFLTINNAAFFALAGSSVAANHPSAFWLFTIGFGVALLALAAISARRAPGEAWFDGAYLAQGLSLTLLGLLFKFTGWQLALSFALASGTLISLGRLRHGGMYRCFAALCAIIAASVAVHAQYANADHARLTAAAVAAVLLADAWLLKRSTGFAAGLDWRVLGFSLLAAITSAAACIDDAPLPSAGRVLAVALFVMALLRWHRLPEAAVIAQPLALFGQGLLILRFFLEPNPDLPAIASAGFGLAFIHLWQRKSAPAGRWVWPPLHCLAPVVLALAWTFQQTLPLHHAPLLAAFAILVLAYALATRAWVLLGASSIFTLFALGTTAGAIAERAPWSAPALAIALVGAQSLVLRVLSRNAPFSPVALRGAEQTLRAFALVLSIGMVFAYAPASSWFLAFTGAGLVLFVLGKVSRSSEARLHAAALGTLAAITWVGRLPFAPPHSPDFFGLLAFAVAQRLDRRLPLPVQAALCAFAGVGVWILAHRLVGEAAGGFLLTVTWSLLAFGVLGIGFACRERTYRLLGLLILAAAIGRVFVIDVWQLETIYRILSFLVLGVVLLALGFLYNRFAETLRRWL